jgi:hypothetical protein
MGKLTCTICLGAPHHLAQVKLQLQQVTTAYQKTQAEYDALKVLSLSIV